ncbi:MAG: DNA polymerase, partial [Patescibacteria group bacterium]
MRTNKLRALALRDRLIKERDSILVQLKETGLIREDGTKDLKLIRERIVQAYEAKNCPPPLTEKENISTDREVLEESGDPELTLIAKHTGLDKQCGTFIPLLLQATDYPFNPAWNVLVTSGRTSCGSADAVGNMQNLPRDGEIRGCFEPRQGYYYCSVDYDTAELRSLGQCNLDLVGYSVMADELNNGMDPHLGFAAFVLNIPYEQTVKNKNDKKIKEYRQFGKIFNFGAPGGMKPPALTQYAKGYGVDLSLARATELYDYWINHYTEMRDFFRFNKSLTGYGNTTTYKHHISGFVRGGMGYTELCNFHFQHLTATGAKDALWEVSKECYTDNKSALYESYPVVYVHD